MPLRADGLLCCGWHCLAQVSERRVFMDSKKVELMANMEQTQGDWLQGLKEIEERQVDAMYGVQKAEQLMARRGSELEAASADASAAQAKLDGVLAAQADAKRALAEEEVALARTVRHLLKSMTWQRRWAHSGRTQGLTCMAARDSQVVFYLHGVPIYSPVPCWSWSFCPLNLAVPR